jgi:hypothetical protein
VILSLKELQDRPVQALAGSAGRVEDFYFDDGDWVVRYLSVDSQDWLDGRRLLFSTRALGELDARGGAFQVQADREMIRNSPIFEQNQSFGREQEIELHDYYRWPFYWTPGDAGGLGPGSLAAYPLVELAEEMLETSGDSPLDNHTLHSFRQLTDCSIHARDGSIGKLFDLLVEGENWNIYYLIVNTGNWLPGRKVLVSPNWIQKVDWSTSHVDIDLNKETIRNSPEYDPSVKLDEDYNARLNRYYGKERER